MTEWFVCFKLNGGRTVNCIGPFMDALTADAHHNSIGYKTSDSTMIRACKYMPVSIKNYYITTSYNLMFKNNFLFQDHNSTGQSC